MYLNFNFTTKLVNFVWVEITIRFLGLFIQNFLG